MRSERRIFLRVEIKKIYQLATSWAIETDGGGGGALRRNKKWRVTRKHDRNLMERCCLETAAAHYITRALERTNYKLVDRRFLRSMIEQAAEMLKRCELSRVFFLFGVTWYESIIRSIRTRQTYLRYSIKTIITITQHRTIKVVRIETDN